MTSPDLESVYSQYFKALLEGDSTQCKSIIQSLLNQNINILELYEHLFRRSLYEIGELWAKNLISVAEEHIATAITENLLTQIQARVIASSQVHKNVLVSCVTSDLHQIGAKMVANLFELHGWGSYYLGANMPITDLLEAIDRLQPDVICLSLALIEHIKTLEVTIKEIRFKYPQTPIIVGGQAFTNLDPHTHHLDQFQQVHLLHSVIQLEQLISSFS